MSAISFNGSIAELYDSELGPVIFTPFAKDFVTKIPIPTDGSQASRVLELAAGTGRLTTELRRVLPAGCALTVTDISEEMLNVAKSSSSSSSSSSIDAGSVNYIPANMLDLPFPAASFDLVVAQFGFMLVSDFGKAFSEARRVLAPGGRLMFNVWSTEDKSPMFTIVMGTVGTYVNDPAMKAKLEQMDGVAYRLSNKEEVGTLLTSAGFSSYTETPVPIVVTDTVALSRGLVLGTPFTGLIPQDQRAACVQQTTIALGTSCPMQAHLYEAW